MSIHYFSILGPTLFRPARKRQAGVELVEMVLFLGYFVILIFMILEMAMLLYAFISNGALSREALRYAVVRGSRAAEDTTRQAGDARTSAAKIQSFIDTRKIHSGAFQVKVEHWVGGKWESNNNDANWNIGTPIKITVTDNYNPIVIPGLSFFDINLESSAQGMILY